MEKILTIGTLLRTAIGTRSAVINPQEAQALSAITAQEWSQLLDYAKQHKVAAVALDGLQKICDSNPDLKLTIMEPEQKALRHKWYSTDVWARRRYQERLQVIRSLTGFYAGHNIRTMVLKGYGLCQEYPIPEHRRYSDVDIYLFGNARLADQLLLREKGIKADTDSVKHSHFSVGKVSVENHYFFLNSRRIPKLKLADSNLMLLAGDSTPDSDTGCLLPSVAFNAQFLPLHTAIHFVLGRATLSHLLDWALFLKNHSNQVEWSQLMVSSGYAGCIRFVGMLSMAAAEFFDLTGITLPVTSATKEDVEWLMSELDNPLPHFSHEMSLSAIIRNHIIRSKRFRRVFKSSYIVSAFRTLQSGYKLSDFDEEDEEQ